MVLEYKEWRNFNKVLERAKIACENSGFDVESDFVEVNKIVEAGGTMPEDLPTPEKSLKQLEKENKKSLKK